MQIVGSVSTFKCSLVSFFIQIICRASVVFTDLGSDENYKGIVLTDPPALPKYFKVRKGGRKDVLVDSDSEAEDSEDEHNKAVLDDDCSSSGGVGEHGDN